MTKIEKNIFGYCGATATIALSWMYAYGRIIMVSPQAFTIITSIILLMMVIALFLLYLITE